MKELSIEEKAKAYDNAIKRAIRMFSEKELNYLFPELAESDDERIRKDLISFVRNDGWKYIKLTKEEKESWVAWLEKQGEQKASYTTIVETGDGWINALVTRELPTNGDQKPDDKNEPKFKVGDWVIDKQGIVHQVANVVETVTNNTYGYDIVGGGYFNDSAEDVRLWNISDAKDGDILAVTMYPEGTWIGIFKEQNGCTFSTYCFLNTAGTFKRGTYGHGNGKSIHPATKEQRDKFEKAMADAGYVFDFEKKELKEIENEEYDGEDYGIDSLWHAKNILEKTLGKVDGYQTDDGILDHKCAISFIDKLYKQKPAEWSEEDESNFQMLIDVIKENKHHATDYEHMTYYKLLSWFKSLKERYVWKPIDEQIDALEHFVRSIGESGFASPYDDNMKLLYSLLEQLKKLKG